ncbi:MAG: hypothetical protein K1000chlam2_00297 [Chlamydiae bacterium]|nr:hypothetical protein [Chlamydiota bacterium]
MLPKIFYAKFRKQDLEEGATVRPSGSYAIFFFDSPQHPELIKNLSAGEVIAKVPIEAFVGEIHFIPEKKGVWKNSSPIQISEISILAQPQIQS